MSNGWFHIDIERLQLAVEKLHVRQGGHTSRFVLVEFLILTIDNSLLFPEERSSVCTNERTMRERLLVQHLRQIGHLDIILLNGRQYDIECVQTILRSVVDVLQLTKFGEQYFAIVDLRRIDIEQLADAGDELKISDELLWSEQRRIRGWHLQAVNQTRRVIVTDAVRFPRIENPREQRRKDEGKLFDTRKKKRRILI